MRNFFIQVMIVFIFGIISIFVVGKVLKSPDELDLIDIQNRLNDLENEKSSFALLHEGYFLHGGTYHDVFIDFKGYSWVFVSYEYTDIEDFFDIFYSDFDFLIDLKNPYNIIIFPQLVVRFDYYNDSFYLINESGDNLTIRIWGVR